MGIRPAQLTDPRLKVVFGGVSRDDVLATLADVQQDYQALLADIESLRGQLADATAKLVSVHAGERETTRTISRAEQDAGTIRQNALVRAEGLQQEAEAKVAALLRHAEAERDALDAYIARLAGGRARLHRVLETEIDELRTFLSAGPQAQAASLFVAASPPEPAPPLSVSRADSWELARQPEAADVDIDVAEVEAASSDFAEADATPEPAPCEAWSAEDIESALKAAVVEPPPPAAQDVAVPLAQEASGPSVEDPTAPPVPAITAIAADPRYVAAVQAFLQDESELEDESPEEESSKDGTPSRRLMPGLAMAAAGVAVVGIVAVLAFPRSAPQAVEGSAPRTASAGAAVGRPGTGATPQRSVPGPAPAVAMTGVDSSQRGAGSAPLVVRLEARRPCWVGVTIGDRKESRLLGQGEEIVRESSSDVILRVGDAGALIVTVNDRRLAPLGGDGEVVTRRISLP